MDDTHDLVSSVTKFSPRWTYEDESQWPGDKCNGGGVRQSPIDIKSSSVIKDFAQQFIQYGNLILSDYHQVLLTAINNGYTIMFSTVGDKEVHPTVTGGPLRHEYRLEQVHFHWLSEHAIDGVKFPLEIHFVHVRSDLNVKQALKKRDGLAIFAVFCKILDQEDQIERAFDELTFLLSKLKRVESQVSDALLNLNKLLSPNTDLYYTYAGSLTSPMCNEVVTWIIFPETIYITEAQYNLFLKVRRGRYNFRNLQEVKSQLVFQPPVGFFKTPQIVTSLKNAVFTVAEFFQNVTRFMMNGMKTP
ncbi:unnamed protein product [Parnassius apollo]|uniref:Carbonic anhydrase n=1 Tax=Parnassius apollo TaxID=110799 RepID=A0A8S3XNU5_PARAO|nr:unnamed protein product [Parnassius apollo]